MQLGGSVNASAQIFVDQIPIAVDSNGGLLSPSLGHRWLTLLSVAAIKRLTPPNPTGGRVSRLPPAVKCSECNEPIPIHERGEHVCAANTQSNNPPRITPPAPLFTHSEIENEATNRIPSSEPRSPSHQESPLQNVPDRTHETTTDAGGPTFGSVGSKPPAWDFYPSYPTPKYYYQPDGPVESQDALVVDPDGPPFPQSGYLDNTYYPGFSFDGFLLHGTVPVSPSGPVDDGADEDGMQGYPRGDDDAFTPLISLASTPSLASASSLAGSSSRDSSARSISLAERLANTRRNARRERVEEEQPRRDTLRGGFARLKDALPVSNQKSSKVALLERGLSLVSIQVATILTPSS